MNTVPHIVVGVEGFESSKAALRWAIHQAKLTGAVVDAVTTWHIPPDSGVIPAVDMPDYQDDARIILGRLQWWAESRQSHLSVQVGATSTRTLQQRAKLSENLLR